MESMEYKGPTGKLIAIQLSLGALVLLVAYCYNALARMRANRPSRPRHRRSGLLLLRRRQKRGCRDHRGRAPHGGEVAGLCCSICLAEFEESEVLRMLPDCKHVFHLACVDAWLRLKPTCPNCRTDVAGSGDSGRHTSSMRFNSPLTWT